jgi:anti-anti-sigma factor
VKVAVQRGDDATARLTLAGELDLATAGVLDEHVRRVAGDRPARLIVDLAGVTFCDSSGIEALLRACAFATDRDIDFRVVNPTGVTRRAFQLTGVLDLLTTADARP